MSQWTAEDVAKHNARIGAKMPAHVPTKSKYRNVRTLAEGEVFDSKREADYWRVLKSRERLGEISELKRQVEFPLYCPMLCGSGDNRQVARYIADFTYVTGSHDDLTHQLHVVDAKGRRTQMYALKAKWMELQNGFVIEEV